MAEFESAKLTYRIKKRDNYGDHRRMDLDYLTRSYPSKRKQLHLITFLCFFSLLIRTLSYC